MTTTTTTPPSTPPRVQLTTQLTSPCPYATTSEGAAFLCSLLNKNLRITTPDDRMFRGEFKCTDDESNIVLHDVFEYRPPSRGPSSSADVQKGPHNEEPGGNTIKAEMRCRYLGQVVIPGQHIVKMEVEEFASQVGNSTIR